MPDAPAPPTPPSSAAGPTISALQRRLALALTGLRHPPLGSAAALAEEVGELSKHLVDHHCYGKAFDDAAFGAELADVFICLAELATLHGVDLESATLAKIADVEAKAPEWRRQLGGALDRAWRTPYGAAVRPPL
jgi:NTP pyrophosphatase (non-canonical NTP hydrolase)